MAQATQYSQQYVANPRTTFDLVTVDSTIGPENQRALLIGQMTTGSATPGALFANVPRTFADIAAAFGANSHLAQIAMAYREVNTVTQVDALPLSDASGGTLAAAAVGIAGTATAAGILYFSVVSQQNHTYEVDVNIGDTPSVVAAALMAAIAADLYMPFTAASSVISGLQTVTLTAANKGLGANDWLLAVQGKVPGLTVTLTGWAGGATNPSLTSLWDPVASTRYQTIVWPNSYTLGSLSGFLNPRKNVANNVMDGRGFVYLNQPFSTVMATALGLNSSEIVVLNNQPTAMANRWLGPYLPEAPDVIAAKFAAARDLRLSLGADISSVVVTNAPNDQVGGPSTASLPYFNTPLIGVAPGLAGTGHTYDEQVELEASGVSVIGDNRFGNSVIAGQIVTTWLNDAAGNPDQTWKYLEWRDTHGMIREFFQENCQKRFAQTRLTTGDIVGGFDMTNQQTIFSFCQLLYQQLTQMALTVEGQAARTAFEQSLVITLTPSQRLAAISMVVPMVSQLGQINGVIQYTFTVGSSS